MELKKLESDYEQKLQELSQEKELLASSKQEREKENQGLQQQLSSLQHQVQKHTLTCLSHSHLHILYTSHSGEMKQSSVKLLIVSDLLNNMTSFLLYYLKHIWTWFMKHNIRESGVYNGLKCIDTGKFFSAPKLMCFEAQ